MQKKLVFFFFQWLCHAEGEGREKSRVRCFVCKKKWIMRSCLFNLIEHAAPLFLLFASSMGWLMIQVC